MADFLLDTCAWVDALLAPEKLNSKTRRLLSGQNKLYLSSISLIEFARKEARGEISLRMPCHEWFAQVALPKGRITLLDISPEIAVEATRLPGSFNKPNGSPHKDPADQIIVATARCHGLTLLTSDQVMLAYGKVKTLLSRGRT
jgi:PIN domain nuclease of toxin-antitoxin system